jgi:hypothetical protein
MNHTAAEARAQYAAERQARENAMFPPAVPLRELFTAFDPSRSNTKDLPPVQQKQAIPGAVGVGRRTAPQASAGTGMSGPLTEVTRTFHPVQSFVSTDGIFVVDVQPIKVLTMTNDPTQAPTPANTVTWTFKNA